MPRLRPQAGSSQPHLLLRRRADVSARAPARGGEGPGDRLHRRHRPQHRRGCARGRWLWPDADPSLPRVIPGIELSTEAGEIIGLYVTEDIPARSPLDRSRRRASGTRGVWSICLIPTTCSAAGPSSRAERARAAELSDIVEVVNGRSLGPVRHGRPHGWRGGWASRQGRAATRTARRRWVWPTCVVDALPTRETLVALGRGGHGGARASARGSTLSTGGCRAVCRAASTTRLRSDRLVARHASEREEVASGRGDGGSGRRSKLVRARRSGEEWRGGPRVHCFLCAHHCRIAPGERGLCGVRENRDGVLYTLVYGCPISTAVDPIEKKPLFHFLPGQPELLPGHGGLQLHLRLLSERRHQPDAPRPGPDRRAGRSRPSRWSSAALAAGCPSISYTYTEPTIFYEYARDCARLATAAGLKNVFVTNGYMTAETLRRHRRRSARGQRRSQVVLRRVLPRSGGRAAEAGPRLHPALVGHGGVGGGDHAAHPRAQRRRGRAALLWPRSWPRSRPTSPGTCRASIPPIACSTCRRPRWTRWRGPCASGARKACTTSTGATSPDTRRSRRPAPRAGESVIERQGFRLRKNRDKRGQMSLAAAGRSPGWTARRRCEHDSHRLFRRRPILRSSCRRWGATAWRRRTPPCRPCATLRERAAALAPDTIVLLSPHRSPGPPVRWGCRWPRRTGDLWPSSGRRTCASKRRATRRLAEAILDEAAGHGVPATITASHGEMVDLDHGAMVPLVYLMGGLERPCRLVLLSFSYLSLEEHVRFGEAVGRAMMAASAAGRLRGQQRSQPPAASRGAGRLRPTRDSSSTGRWPTPSPRETGRPCSPSIPGWSGRRESAATARWPCSREWWRRSRRPADTRATTCSRTKVRSA